MIAKYLQKTRDFLVNKHEYEIKINKRKGYYVYDIAIIRDITKDKDINKMINLTSPISIKKYFGIENFELEDIDYDYLFKGGLEE